MKSSKRGGASGNHRRYVSGSKHCTHVRYMFNNVPIIYYNAQRNKNYKEIFFCF